MQSLNLYLFTLGKCNLEKYARSKLKPVNPQQCQQLLENHITYSTEFTYQKILTDNAQRQQNNAIDLSRQLKQHYISISPQTVTQKIALQSAIMQKHSHIDEREPAKSIIYGRKLCCSGFYFDMNSTPRRLLELLQLLNLIYIGIATPIHLGFSI